MCGNFFISPLLKWNFVFICEKFSFSENGKILGFSFTWKISSEFNEHNTNELAGILILFMVKHAFPHLPTAYI